MTGNKIGAGDGAGTEAGTTGRGAEVVEVTGGRRGEVRGGGKDGRVENRREERRA